MRPLLPSLVASLVASLVLSGTPALAKPFHYQLDQTASEVAFEIDMGQGPLRGKMPVSAADLILDFDRAAASSVSVTLDASRAKMPLPFATEAMKSDSVLATRTHPEIRFESTRLSASGQKATVAGKITIRGVTRPIVMSAQIFRPKGSAAGERDQLSVRLTGTIHRSDFGASGFADMVGEDVRLDITVRIRRTGS